MDISSLFRAKKLFEIFRLFWELFHELIIYLPVLSNCLSTVILLILSKPIKGFFRINYSHAFCRCQSFVVRKVNIHCYWLLHLFFTVLFSITISVFVILSVLTDFFLFCFCLGSTQASRK